jgi:hypothetical protein
VDAAQVYRCVDAQGRVEYADVPCTGASGGPIAISPNVIPGVDQATVRALSRAIDERSAARIAAEEQARAARRPPMEMPTPEPAPWWQQGGTPPDREQKPAQPVNPPPVGPTPTPPIAPPVRPLAPGR